MPRITRRMTRIYRQFSKLGELERQQERQEQKRKRKSPYQCANTNKGK